jgi:hypothetical protein
MQDSRLESLLYCSSIKLTKLLLSAEQESRLCGWFVLLLWNVHFVNAHIFIGQYPPS